jgi:hypothetical protein
MLTGLALVREYFPRATKDDANYLLWEQTPYPCGNPREELSKIAALVLPKKRGWRRRFDRVCRARTEQFDRELAEVTAAPVIAREWTDEYFQYDDAKAWAEANANDAIVELEVIVLCPPTRRDEPTGSTEEPSR